MIEPDEDFERFAGRMLKGMIVLVLLVLVVAGVAVWALIKLVSWVTGQVI